MEKYNEDKLLTTQQLAKMLLVNPETLRSWRWKGTHGPNFIKIGYRVRYKMSDVKEYLDKHPEEIPF